jgi:hypothetical protein
MASRQPVTPGRSKRGPRSPRLRAETQPENHPAHQQPLLRSSMPDRVAVRLNGITYLLAPGAVKGFLARNTPEDHKGA